MGGALHEANSATLRRALVEYIAAKPAVSTDRLYAAFAALPELEVADEMSDMEAAGIIYSVELGVAAPSLFGGGGGEAGAKQRCFFAGPTLLRGE